VQNAGGAPSPHRLARAPLAAAIVRPSCSSVKSFATSSVIGLAAVAPAAPVSRRAVGAIPGFTRFWTANGR
jgi:hypothetical protein